MQQSSQLVGWWQQCVHLQQLACAEFCFVSFGKDMDEEVDPI